jgi:hypothetical protein
MKIKDIEAAMAKLQILSFTQHMMLSVATAVARAVGQ